MMYLMRFSVALLILLVLFFLSLNLPHLLEFTPVWPDEAWISDVALNILKTGQPGTRIWGEIPDATKHALWYPPIFLYLLAGWFKVFGFSIVIQRSLSVVITVIFISIFYIFSKFLISEESGKISNTKASLLAFLGSTLLIIDPTFFKASVISRPEILVLDFITLSGFLLFKILSGKLTKTWEMVFLILSGLFIGLSVMTHFLAGIFLASFLLYWLFFIFNKKSFFDKNFYIFMVFAFIPSAIWILSNLDNLNILKSQVMLLAQERTLIPSWLNLSFSILPLTNRISYLLYLIVTFILFTVYLMTKKNHLLIPLLLSGAAWVFAYFGKIEWYAVYITPFVYIALILLLVYSISNKKGFLLKDLKYSVISISVILFILGVNNYINIASYTNGKSYFELEKKARLAIPKGKTVFLSSIPDLYYAFKPDNSYQLYRLPLVEVNPDDFKKVLTKLDYAAINFSLSNAFIKNMQDNFLEENTSKKFKITAGGYEVYIYELKHKD